MAERPPLYDLTGIRRAFSNRNYALFAAGNSVNLIGTWVQRLGVGWLTWDLTHSGFWLGAVAFADLFPAVAIGLFGGVLADRYDRRRILLVGQWLSLIQAAVLWALTEFGLIHIGSLFLLSLFLGVVVAVVQPARLSLVPSLVRPADVAPAVAINAVIFNAARFLGPALAGVIIHLFGVALAFLVNAATFVTLIAALMALDLAPRPPKGHAGNGVLADIWDGIRYSAGHPAVATLLLLMTATSLLARPAFELLPGFADAVFGQGAEGLAVLTSSVGIGALAGGVWLAQRSSAAGFSLITLGATAASGAAVALFTATATMWVAAPALAMAGFAIVVMSVCSQTLIQTGVEGHVRGRVLSIWGLILRGGPAVGAVVMGWASDTIGLRPSLAIGAALSLAAAVALWRQRPRMAGLLETVRPDDGGVAAPVEAEAVT